MKKLYSLLFALLAFAGMANAQVLFDFEHNNLDLPLSDNDNQEAGIVTSITSEGVTITFDSSGASTPCRLWKAVNSTSGAVTLTLRVYKGASFTVSSEENIISIAIGGTDANVALKSDPEGMSGKVWTGSAKSVTFTPDNKNNQIRSITVTLEGGEVPPTPTIDWTSSAEAPLTVAQALEKAGQLEQGEDSGKDVYVKGKISQIDEISIDHGNATYFISDDGTTTNQFYVYRGKYLKGADFTADDQIKVGDDVIIVGIIKNYGGTLEFNQGNRIYSLNGDNGGDDPQPGEAKTIAEVIAGGAALAVVTSGTVYAECPNGILIGDGTGYIFVYKATAAVGDVVKVTGNVSKYGGCFQFAEGSTAEKTGTAAVTYPAVQELDGAALDALIAAPAVTYVKIRGTLKISGNYKNLVVEGTENQGSLLVSDAVLGEAADGNVIDVTGFFVYQTSNGKYGNIIATEVKVDGDTPQPIVPEYATIAAVKEAATATKTTSILKASDLLVTYVNGKNVYVYDGTDGLLLFGDNSGIKTGDKITADVKGDLYLYNGLTEIAVSEWGEITVNSSDNAVEPQEATIADVTNNFKNYENELVTIKELTPTAEAWDNNKLVLFTDDSDNELNVRDNFGTLSTLTFNTATPYTVTGFMAVRATAEETSYRIYPRTVEDLDNGVEPTPYELQGAGTLENPYTIADIQYLQAQEDCPTDPVWVKGYIMGAAKSTMKTIVKEQGEDLLATNIVLADEAAEESSAKMIPVQLASTNEMTKKVRADINLVDNFDNLGKQIWVLGTIDKYFSVPGVKNAIDYSFDGETTGVHAVQADAVDAAIYNIAGQRVSAVGKGLYIVGNKKVLAE